jgi:hypothetical protein
MVKWVYGLHDKHMAALPAYMPLFAGESRAHSQSPVRISKNAMRGDEECLVYVC